MANSASAKRSAKQSEKKRLINKSRKSSIKTCVKKVSLAISAGDKSEATVKFIDAQSQLMKGVKKGVFKLNTASRKISKLAAKLKEMN